jgi:arylsulfatase A-like enzyme
VNVVLLIIDSLRADLLAPGHPERPRTPFLDAIAARSIEFRRAYATECWTLPAHASMFTGLLPSQHGAHFQSMALCAPQPTVAEQLSDAGFHTELITRNPIFDGTLPGITRGFQKLTRKLATPERWDPAAIVLALTKPRLRRQIRETGFFHPDQRRNAAFVAEFARSTFPADRLVLAHALERMADLRREGRPYFLFCNLFDVHAPYCPVDDSLLAPVRSFGDLIESLHALDALARVGRHEYLREGFRMREAGRLALWRRYRSAIERMDAKLGRFYEQAAQARLWDDTLLIVASDHGEAFGDHELYCHDASVYEVNLRVPLWVQHPRFGPAVVDDVVSMRGIANLIASARSGRSEGTLLDPDFRARNPVALAEHFHYPRVPRMQERYRQNIAAAICAERKVIARRDEVLHFELAGDPGELRPERAPIETFRGPREHAAAFAHAALHLSGFQHQFGRAA